jgi:ubiquinone/menaquinone biosynthesis C-methylase UbiE
LGEEQYHSDAIPVCDYEGSDYRARFWGDQKRSYEDLAERIAIRRLLPRTGGRLLEIGTGFGRLVDLYQGYEQILLLDYSASMLREAQERLGREPRYTYVAADLYHMPFVDGLVDTACMVRVMHHVADVSGALGQIHRVIRPGGAYLLEFASKLHLKSILRYAVRRQSWNPFVESPVEFVELNFDFHPRWMRDRLSRSGFAIERVRTVSRFRIPLLKRFVPAQLLAVLDGALQWVGGLWQLTPSVFVLARRQGAPPGSSLPTGLLPAEQLLRCPTCTAQQWAATSAALACESCGVRWPIEDGIYNFKAAR